jgi:hypothetical protein
MIDHLGDWNPQFFREIKGRLKPKNIAIVSFASIIGQGLLYLYFNSLLPTVETRYGHRYCTGENLEYSSQAYCTQDLLGNVQTIKELWWLDLFTTMSIIGIFILLVAGSYMLMADITKEKSNKTLNFLLLTPQSAMTILSGKMLGVPILIFLFGLLAVPLHLIAGLQAHIPLYLIASFYLILGASCIFFYTTSLLFSLLFPNLGSFQAWLGSLMIFFFLVTMMGITLEGNSWTHTSFDWLMFFYPGTFLAYLAQSTFIAPYTIDYLSMDGLNNVSWYGHYLGANFITYLTFTLVNYSLWTVCLWQGVKRRFHSPKDVVISKINSYFISAFFIIFNLGFTLQEGYKNHYNNENLAGLFAFNFILALLLTGALTPQRQTLQDWARFRHESSYRASRMKDLLIGEKSPATLAIAVNMMIITLYILPAMWLFPEMEDKLELSIISLLSAMIIIIYATVYQLTLMLKTKKRNFVATATVTGLIFSPPLSIVLLGVNHTALPTVGLFSALPLVSISEVSIVALMGSLLTQLIMIIGANYQLTRVLKQVGISETKSLISA